MVAESCGSDGGGEWLSRWYQQQDPIVLPCIEVFQVGESSGDGREAEDVLSVKGWSDDPRDTQSLLPTKVSGEGRTNKQNRQGEDGGDGCGRSNSEGDDCVGKEWNERVWRKRKERIAVGVVRR
jgi:hypothetical protein